MIDLCSLIEQKAPTRLSKTAASHGGEYAGMCPFCQAGTDRFRVWPDSERPHYWCRVCEASGDLVQFLKDYCNMTYVEACAELDINPGETPRHEASLDFDDDPPCKEWQAFGRMLVEKAQTCLWEKAPHALSYLLKRGFTEETMKQAKLGYIPLARDGKWFSRPFSDWGLTDEMLSEKQKEKGNVKVPPGILIPWFADGHLWKIAIKRFEAGDNKMKYGQVIGSKDALYNADSLTRGKPALLCEGEFDVLSVIQEVGDQVATIGTGSAQKGRLPLWIARMASLATTKLLGFDLDEAGADAAAYWQETFGDSAVRWPPFSHDVNDMLKEKKDIRAWVQTGLEIATYKPTAQPLQGVVDGLPPLPDILCAHCPSIAEDFTSEGTPYCTNHKPAPPEEFVWLTCLQCHKHYLHNSAFPQVKICSWCRLDNLPKYIPPTPPLFRIQTPVR